jgi:hypothetical protein
VYLPEGWEGSSLHLNILIILLLHYSYSSVKNTHDFYSQKKELTSKPVLCNGKTK